MRSAKSTIQGEGDYVSAKKFNERSRRFAESGKVEQAARDAAPRDAREQDEMRRAEDEGRSHAKGQGNTARDPGSAPGRPPTEKKAPGKHPQGHDPIPEKLRGR